MKDFGEKFSAAASIADSSVEMRNQHEELRSPSVFICVHLWF
jgi:hypothetical protein